MRKKKMITKTEKQKRKMRLVLRESKRGRRIDRKTGRGSRRTGWQR